MLTQRRFSASWDLEQNRDTVEFDISGEDEDIACAAISAFMESNL